MLLNDLITDKQDQLTVDSALDAHITIHNDRPLDMAIEIMNDHKVDQIRLLDENEEYAGTLTKADIELYCMTLNDEEKWRLFCDESSECKVIEAKFRDAKATFNMLGIAFCEIIYVQKVQIIRWLNAEAMMTFGVNIDDPISKMLTPEIWDHLMEIFNTHGGVDHERIKVRSRVYDVTLMEVELLGQRVLKLFLNDVSELVRLGDELRLSLERKIEHIAHYDGLTDLPNRLLLLAKLDHAISHPKRPHEKVVVLDLNLDHFKDINESYGHAVGDDVIVQVAQKLSSVLGRGDTLARVGGDEFIIVLEGLQDVLKSEEIVNRVQALFDNSFTVGEVDFTLSASIGIAAYPDDGESGEILLKNADIALRRAKDDGRNKYCFFSSDMSVQLFERVLLERELRRGIEASEFLVYYQPQVSLQTGKLTGAEALVRWNHPVMGIVSPDVFIPLCESNNLIIPIGEQILRDACIQVKLWKEQGLFEGRISVNVSGKQFERPDIVEVIKVIIDEIQLEPRYLELEMTESVLMGNPQIFGEKLMELKTLGIEVAIDDFGTGYSSLSYLKQFPIDKLKIDQSFVGGIPHNEQDMAIVKAVIAMSKALGFRTIAEGIEKVEQAEFLKNFGCEQGQGYLYSRPLSAEKFEEFLKALV
ncbi:MAG TPA: EAL domain-containing protein [Sulfuricurvum sp.]|nr:EAL domain-containing protein [Sulfuricurvum sp.]